MRYVVLLRGVNVGGSRRVAKVDFQQVLESLGFRDVVIYINSGNAVFTSDSDVKVYDIQAALEARFGFIIPTLLVSGEQMRKIAEAIPSEWSNDTPKPDKSGQKSDVLFLFDEINTPGIVEQIGYNPEVETIFYVDGALVANITRKNQARGSLQKLVGSKLYHKMTIRNITTVKKLAELVQR